jgi:phage terminase large subunit-like protein
MVETSSAVVHHIIEDEKLRKRVLAIAHDSRPLALREEAAEIMLEAVDRLGEDIFWEWELWARPTQLAPGPNCRCCRGKWLNWLVLAGRGWGKTRAGAEWCQTQVNQGRYGRLHLVGPTVPDARDIMVEGPSGIIATGRPWNKVRYQPTKRRLEWENGAMALVFSADEPDRLRGMQAEAAWVDELASWRYPESWEQLQLGLRLGPFPRTVITTTPRPTKLIKTLAKSPTSHVTRGITYENLHNLAAAFLAEVVRVYEGTPFGRQEIYADILDDAPGAIFHMEHISGRRIGVDELPELERTVVAVDPALSSASESDETGIMVVGRDSEGHGYVLEDGSGKLRPEQWADRVSDLYHSWGANVVVAEANQGGQMVEHTLNVHDPSLAVKMVWAKKAKVLRAEPVSSLYVQGKVHHVGDRFEILEDQMINWEPGQPSPDRLDALVYGITDLLVGRPHPAVIALGENETGRESYWKGIGEAKTRRPPWLSER